MIGWATGWVGICALMMLVCMVMMVPMMGRMGHGHSGHGWHGVTDDPQRTLGDRLARGEIDAEEYHRLSGELREGNHSART